MSVELISDERPRARKHHRCFHCGGWIVPGEAHRKSTCKYDYVYSLRIHDDCEALWKQYESDAGFSFYDFDDGYPPIREEWGNSGEFQSLCDSYRGKFPGPVTRMEFHEQISDIKWRDHLAARGITA